MRKKIKVKGSGRGARSTYNYKIKIPTCRAKNRARNGAPILAEVRGLRSEAGKSNCGGIDIGDLTQVNCADCHTGGTGP